MSDLVLRLEGIYDIRTYSYLEDLGVRDFLFDFRPLSANFLQQYLFMELIKTMRENGLHFYLNYEDEKDFVIKKMIDDIEALPEVKEITNKVSFNLEFSDKKDLMFYEQFRYPFLWHFQEDYWPKGLGSSSFFKGIVIDYKIVDRIKKREGMSSFLNTFYQLIKNKLDDPEFQIILKDFDNKKNLNFAMENFDINQISLKINSEIESSFRTIDFYQLEQRIILYNNFITLSS